MRTCEEPRPPNGPSPIAITAGQRYGGPADIFGGAERCAAYLFTLTVSVSSEYGFAEKVVEGMSVRINSITIKVQARAFHASFELWQLQGNSLNPKWQRSDLRYTRITDPKRGEVPPPPNLPQTSVVLHDQHFLELTFVVTRTIYCLLHLLINQVLTFKEINWQSLRIEADAIESDDQDLGSTPLRLITNQGRIRIALKRRVCFSF